MQRAIRFVVAVMVSTVCLCGCEEIEQAAAENRARQAAIAALPQHTFEHGGASSTRGHIRSLTDGATDDASLRSLAIKLTQPRQDGYLTHFTVKFFGSAMEMNDANAPPIAIANVTDGEVTNFTRP